MTVSFVVGGILSALADLTYLAGTDYWRLTGWTAHPAASMVAIGRASAAASSLTRWPEAVGFLLLALGLLSM